MTLTIVSGAAPGVEQGAIEAAVNLALRWQGWAPEQSILTVPPVYRTGLQPTSSTDQGMVRRLNIQGSDGALVFSTSMVLAGVAAFVDRWTEKMGRAFLHVTLNPATFGLGGVWTRVDGTMVDLRIISDEVRDHVRNWIRKNDLARVYVTGPSADDVPGIQGAVRDALIAILEPFAVDEVRQTTRVLGLIEQAAVVSVPTQLRIGDPTDCRGEPLDLSPPEGFDEAQRADLDASIREAERDIRDPVEERFRAYHELAATAPGPIGVAEHDDGHSCEDHPENCDQHEPPAPGDQ